VLKTSKDYARAGVPMLPVVAKASEGDAPADPASTRCFMAAGRSSLPALSRASRGWPYLAVSARIVLGVGVRLVRDPCVRSCGAGDAEGAPPEGVRAKALFGVLDPLSLRDVRDAARRGGDRRRATAGDDRRMSAMADEQDGVRLTEAQRKRRRSRSIAIALVLGGLVVLFYVVTIVKLGPGILDRPM
jgi:hypothetical protein